MGFTPTEDSDTGTIFNGFTHDEAVFLLDIMSTSDDIMEFPKNAVTYYIQTGHFYHPQEMIEELLAGRTFTIYDKSEKAIIVGWPETYAIFYTDKMLFAVGKKIHSCKFKEDILTQVIEAYETYKTIYDEAKAQYEAGTITYAEYHAIVDPVYETYEATLEELMPEAGGGGSEEETAKRNIYFDKKKRMLYIDGNYYNTIFIKRSTEE